jgi:multiple sugar transport system substrate-binding protein
MSQMDADGRASLIHLPGDRPPPLSAPRPKRGSPASASSADLFNRFRAFACFALSRSRFSAFLLVAILIAGCARLPERDSQGRPLLRFSFWGDRNEKRTIEAMCARFNATHPRAHVLPIHYVRDYATKISIMAAAGTLPDVGYMGEDLMDVFGASGMLVDLKPLFDADPDFPLSEIDPRALYWRDGRLVGISIANETIVMYYNKRLFDEAGLPYPPSRAEAAWTWDRFLAVARRLTRDERGRHPGEAGFDPENIVQYGASISSWWPVYLPLVWSNGGDVVDATGRQVLVDRPEFAEPIQRVADAWNKEHVAPTMTARGALPNASTSLETGKVAMYCGGQWELETLSQGQFPLGIGVLPRFRRPTTVVLCAPSVIFASTRHRAEAWQLYKFSKEASHAPDVYRGGLWMPVQRRYYTPEGLRFWTESRSAGAGGAARAVHPPEYRTAVVDFEERFGRPSPSFWLKNWPAMEEVITAALDPVWLGRQSAASALRAVRPRLQRLAAGKWQDG